jgi:4-amino-4-deoxy-L-arabinose transferase-like glycosyltransferase
MHLYLVLVPTLFFLTILGPGYLCVRRLDWSAEEKITGSIAVSLLLLYLVCFGAFASGLSRIAHVVIFATCALLTVATVHGIWSLFSSWDVRRPVAGFGLLGVWVLALLGVVRNYSGGTWYGDWFEHYQRSLFFLGGHDLAETFQDYALPARPPLVNVVAAHFLSLAGDTYRIYQLVDSLLALLVYFPACLIARLADPGRRHGLGILAAFLMLNPMFVQNATYSWTKLPAAFFVLSGVAFYVAGLRVGDSARFYLAFACLAAGILAHYSGVPYALFLGLHYLMFVLPRRRARWRELAAILLGVALLLGSWFAWSTATYGLRATIESTSSVRDLKGRPAEDRLRIWAGNLRDTLVPHLRRREGSMPPGPGLSWGGVRDTTFNAYQQSLPFGLGLLGPTLLFYELLRRRRVTSRAAPAGRRFWLCFAAFNVVVGVAAHSTAGPLGIAHIVLQPLVILGIAFLASRFEAWHRPMKWAAIAGLGIDAFFGVAVHFWFQSTFLPGLGGSLHRWGPSMSDLLVGNSGDNWSLQLRNHAVFVGNDLRTYAWCLALLAGAALLGALYLLGRSAVRPPPAPSAGD